MHSTKLYIIGNGFDLWHGIPSGLGWFKAYVRSAAPNVHREVETYLPAVGEDWCNLEAALAELEADALIENNQCFMGSYGSDDWSDSGHHDFQYEVTGIVECLSSNLRSLLVEWVRELLIPTRDTALHLMSKLDPRAQFLTFNYTETLSRLYGVHPGRILHIHGCASELDGDLVLGHASNPRSRRSLNDRSDIEEIDSRLAEVNAIIDEYFSTTFKPSEELIAQHQQFFGGLTAVEQVVVLGHSLSPVDESYFRELLRWPNVAASQWTIACRSPEEWLGKHKRLREIGVRPAACQMALWSAL